MFKWDLLLQHDEEYSIAKAKSGRKLRMTLSGPHILSTAFFFATKSTVTLVITCGAHRIMHLTTLCTAMILQEMMPFLVRENKGKMCQKTDLVHHQPITN